MCVCEEDVHEKRKRSKMKREKKEKRNKKLERRENINLFIQINKQTDRRTERQTDGRTDRHKSFIDMRYNTEQYSKSNSIESYSIKLNQFTNKIE